MKKNYLIFVIFIILSCEIPIYNEDVFFDIRIDVVPLNNNMFYIKASAYDGSCNSTSIKKVTFHIENEITNTVFLYTNEYSYQEYYGIIVMSSSSVSDNLNLTVNIDDYKIANTLKLPQLDFDISYNEDHLPDYWNGQRTLTVDFLSKENIYKYIDLKNSLTVDLLTKKEDILFWDIVDKAEKANLNGFDINYYNYKQSIYEKEHLFLTANLYQTNPEVIHVGN